MSNETETSKSPVTTILGIVVGLVLMVAGGWLAQHWHPAWVAQLEAQGIPVNPGATIAAVGVFLILLPIIRMFFITPLAQAIHARTSELERTFSEAESLRAEMTQMRTDYESRLVETEARAREQIQAQIKEAQNLRQQLMAEAAAQADELRRKATEDIERQKQRVLSEMRLEVVNLTLNATERILGENMNNERNRRLVEEFVDKVEVPT